ncbi:hypothetical protein F2P79_009868 [Pimephales promelas]|nr:hypothetical protein F2P79_009868 [Pimephales promelas]
MNSMFSVWTLSSLILTYTLAFPIFNNTRMTISPNFTDQGNWSVFGFPVGARCPLSICGLHILADSLQTGDENAGNIAQDPWGPGKK